MAQSDNLVCISEFKSLNNVGEILHRSGEWPKNQLLRHLSAVGDVRSTRVRQCTRVGLKFYLFIFRD